MNRFEAALSMAYSPQSQSLPVLARTFALAVDQTVAEGLPVESDPAVLVLGAFIAFQTHSDVNSTRGYRQLLTQCEDRAHTNKLGMQ